jgi:hypothetical protein
MSVTDKQLARAEALGRLAARDGQGLADNPYPARQQVERSRWARAHAGVTAKADGALVAP